MFSFPFLKGRYQINQLLYTLNDIIPGMGQRKCGMECLLDKKFVYPRPPQIIRPKYKKNNFEKEPSTLARFDLYLDNPLKR